MQLHQCSNVKRAGGRVSHESRAWAVAGRAGAVISELCLPRRKPPIDCLTFSSGGHAHGHDSHGHPEIRSRQRKHKFGVSSNRNKLADDDAIVFTAKRRKKAKAEPQPKENKRETAQLNYFGV